MVPSRTNFTIPKRTLPVDSSRSVTSRSASSATGATALPPHPNAKAATGIRIGNPARAAVSR